MNRIEHALQLLLRAARRAPRADIEPLPAHLEARIVNRWRSGSLELEDEFAPLVKLFRQAVIFAAVIMLLSGAWNYVENRSGAAATTLTAYATNAQLPP